MPSFPSSLEVKVDDTGNRRILFRQEYQLYAHVQYQNASSKALSVLQSCQAAAQGHVKLRPCKAEECTQVDQITGFKDCRSWAWISTQFTGTYRLHRNTFQLIRDCLKCRRERSLIIRLRGEFERDKFHVWHVNEAARGDLEFWD